MPLILIPPIEDLEFSITNGIVSSKIYDKQDDVNFDIVDFSFLDKDVRRSHFYGVYISQHIRLREYVLMLVTSIAETNFCLLSY